MVARTFESLGGFASVAENDMKPYSTRGNDKDRFQNFEFVGDPTDPFTGTVFIQISQNEPPISAGRNRSGDPFDGSGGGLNWVDVAELVFVDEGGTFFLQLEIEAGSVRAVCTAYVGGKILDIATMR